MQKELINVNKEKIEKLENLEYVKNVIVNNNYLTTEEGPEVLEDEYVLYIDTDKFNITIEHDGQYYLRSGIEDEEKIKEILDILK